MFSPFDRVTAIKWTSVDDGIASLGFESSNGKKLFAGCLQFKNVVLIATKITKMQVIFDKDNLIIALMKIFEENGKVHFIGNWNQSTQGRREVINI
jgi:hypothetical protein